MKISASTMVIAAILVVAMMTILSMGVLYTDKPKTDPGVMASTQTLAMCAGLMGIIFLMIRNDLRDNKREIRDERRSDEIRQAVSETPQRVENAMKDTRHSIKETVAPLVANAELAVVKATEVAYAVEAVTNATNGNLQKALQEMGDRIRQAEQDQAIKQLRDGELLEIFKPVIEQMANSYREEIKGLREKQGA